MEKIKITITRDTVADGKRVKAGKTVTVTEDEARALVRCNKAEMPAEKKDKGPMTTKTAKAVVEGKE